MSRRFEGKVVVITGAGRGMGRTIADMFVDEGAMVVIAARTVSYGKQAVAEIEARGGEALLCQTDVLSRADIFRLIDQAVARFGGIDVIVHCAAEVIYGRLLEISDDDIEKIFASNLKAAFWLTKASAPHLSKARDGGRIVLISSICGTRTVVPGLVAYGTAKAGLNAFIAGAALELARDNITVNGVEPGVTATDRMRSVTTDAQAREIASTVPLGRIGESSEIGEAVLYLASPRAGYTTGRTITVDGGLSLSTTNLASENDR